MNYVVELCEVLQVQNWSRFFSLTPWHFRASVFCHCIHQTRNCSKFMCLVQTEQKWNICIMIFLISNVSFWDILVVRNVCILWPFCKATDTLILNFWWCLLWVSKVEWAALLYLVGHACCMFPEIHLCGETCRPLCSQYGSQANLFHRPVTKHWWGSNRRPIAPFKITLHRNLHHLFYLSLSIFSSLTVVIRLWCNIAPGWVHCITTVHQVLVNSGTLFHLKKRLATNRDMPHKCTPLKQWQYHDKSTSK